MSPLKTAGGAATGCSSSTTSFIGACLAASNGQYPATAYTPSCTGFNESITTAGYAGEYSLVNVISGSAYIFSSSIATDFITVSDNAGTIVYATGTGSATWTSTITGTVRFYTHTNNSCGEASVNRTRSVRCVLMPTITSFTPSSGCSGIVSIAITGTNLTNATAVTIGGTAVSSIVSNTSTQIVVIAGTGTTGTIAVTTAGGTATSASVFTVNPSPTVAPLTGGATSVCSASVTPAFSDVTPGGIWSVANGTGTASVDASGVVTGANAGTVTVLYTVTSGGCSVSATATVTVKGLPATPTVTPTTATVCSNTTSSLTANSPNTSSVILTENFETFNGTTAANGWVLNNTSTGGTPANAAWTALPLILQVIMMASLHTFLTAQITVK